MTASIQSQAFDTFFNRPLPVQVDVQAIREMWLSLDDAYNIEDWQLPLPLWARRRYDLAGEETWVCLQSELSAGCSDQPICIYIHVPFCTSKCGFCDSYSFRLGSHVEEHMEQYLACLSQELNFNEQSRSE